MRGLTFAISCLLSLGVTLGLSLGLSLGLTSEAAADAQRALKARTAGDALAWSAKNGRLRPVMESFPKGGDIHNHLSGAIYAETWLDWAAEDGLCADMSVPAIRALKGDTCAASGWITAREARDNKDHRREIINSLSNRSYVPTLNWSGHDDFFVTFDRKAASPKRFGDQLAMVARRAGQQNILYLELMETTILGELFPLVSDVKFSGDLDKDYKALMGGAFGAAMPDLVASARRQIKTAFEKKDKILGCGTAQADPGCDVEIRLLHQVVREFEPALVYAQFILGWQMMADDPLVVGANLVAPEDGYIALRDYTLHMRMIDHLYQNLGSRNISLHAGELTIGLVRPRQLEFHIREAIEIGHAKRIGHGIDIVYEDNMEILIERMIRDDIMVEINLTSNETILGVSGPDHPIVLYRDMQVPYALSTDDEGVSRIDLTHEYMRFYQDYDVPYFELRHASRNSLTYSFLPGGSLWDNAACSSDAEGGEAASAACRDFLKGSEKARLQWKLEERFRAFEDNLKIPVRKRTSFK